MKIKIAIQDREEAEKYESMNMAGATPTDWVDFYFRLDLLESMWHDPSDNLLVLGINGSDFRTLYSKALHDRFAKHLGFAI